MEKYKIRFQISRRSINLIQEQYKPYPRGVKTLSRSSINPKILEQYKTLSRSSINPIQEQYKPYPGAI